MILVLMKKWRKSTGNNNDVPWLWSMVMNEIRRISSFFDIDGRRILPAHYICIVFGPFSPENDCTFANLLYEYMNEKVWR